MPVATVARRYESTVGLCLSYERADTESSTARTVRSRDAVEKERIAHRRDGFPVSRRSSEERIIDTTHTLITGDTTAYPPIQSIERERVIAGEQYASRLRIRRLSAEARAAKQSDADADAVASEEVKRRVYAESTRAQHNAHSLPVDPLTLVYDATADGVRLQHVDALTKWRAARRSERLDRINNRKYNAVNNAPNILRRIKPPPTLMSS